MHRSLRPVHAALALLVAAIIGCGSSSTAPNTTPPGGLWIANEDYFTIPDLSTGQLGTSGTVTPAETLATKVSSPEGLALDAAGNMWVSSESSDSLLMYSIAARNAGGGTAPTTVIVSDALDGAGNIAFDSHGDLWVANCGEELNVLEYTSSQLAAGGTQDPAVIIRSDGTLGCPWSVAFDGSGNMWVGDDEFAVIVEYAASLLTASGTPAPTNKIVQDVSADLQFPATLAFDASGNLWAGNDGPNTVLQYTKTQLTNGGGQAPNVVLTMPKSPNVADPWGLAIDSQGSLWVSDAENEVVYAFTSSQIAASGTPTPYVTLGVKLSGGFSPAALLFDPHATAVGVAASRMANHPIQPAGIVRPLNSHHHHRS